MPGLLIKDLPPPPPPLPTVHLCESPRCMAHGSFGFGFLPGQTGRRFCFAHRAEGVAFEGGRP